MNLFETFLYLFSPIAPKDFEEPVMLFGSADSNSMFGYSIASAGDLDQDGYQGFVFFLLFPFLSHLSHCFLFAPSIYVTENSAS